jgi:hypothetical protein
MDTALGEVYSGVFSVRLTVRMSPNCLIILPTDI